VSGPTDTPSLSELVARIKDELAGVERGHATYRGELLFRCLDFLSRLSGNGGGAGAAPIEEGPADEIVSRLYRRFKDWSKRGFGPDDVTWCEVKADIEEMIRCVRPFSGAATPSASLEEERD